MRKLLLAGAALLALIMAADPADARRRHRHYHAYGWSHHSGALARARRLEERKQAAAAQAAPAAVSEAPAPRLHIIRTIINGVPKAWIGSPPLWAGELHISPLSQGRSASGH